MDFQGQTIHDRYVVAALLGEGGDATVYRAEDRRLGRTVAMKFLRPELRADPTFVARFEREARSAARLEHPHIVPVYDYGEVADTYFLVMQYISGGDLRVRLQPGRPLPLPFAVRLAAEVAEALGAAHARSIVHRDVKPANILLTEDGHAKVTDFGIAKMLDMPALTATAALFGTAHYLAPEQASGSGITPATDVYALGVMLFEMLAGRRPFEGESLVQVAMQHVYARPPALDELNPAVPPALVALVTRALAKDAGQRFANGAALAAALHDQEWGLAPPLPALAVPTAPQPARPAGLDHEPAPVAEPGPAVGAGREAAPAVESVRPVSPESPSLPVQPAHPAGAGRGAASRAEPVYPAGPDRGGATVAEPVRDAGAPAVPRPQRATGALLAAGAAAIASLRRTVSHAVTRLGRQRGVADGAGPTPHDAPGSAEASRPTAAASLVAEGREGERDATGARVPVRRQRPRAYALPVALALLVGLLAARVVDSGLLFGGRSDDSAVVGRAGVASPTPSAEGADTVAGGAAPPSEDPPPAATPAEPDAATAPGATPAEPDAATAPGVGAAGAVAAVAPTAAPTAAPMAAPVAPAAPPAAAAPAAAPPARSAEEPPAAPAPAAEPPVPPAPPPAAPAALAATTGGRVVLDDDAFQGGYSAPRSYRGRTARWIYGAYSAYPRMTAQFTIEGTPGAGELRIVGIDSENGPKTPIEIRINDTVIYGGGNPLPKDHWRGSVAPWGQASFPIPRGVLRPGRNTLTFRNLVPVGNFNSPPYFMLDQAVIVYDRQRLAGLSYISQAPAGAKAPGP